MIRIHSVLPERSTREAVLRDQLRGQAIAELVEAGLPVRDLPLMLNCSRGVIDSLLMWKNDWYRQLMTGVIYKAPQSAIPRPIPRSAAVRLRYRPSRTERGIAGERLRRARKLASEIYQWLCRFKMTDTERQDVFEQAGDLLRETPLTMRGEFVFDKDRAFTEIIRLFKPEARENVELSITTVNAKWLASWIRFWISPPSVWERALDLARAHFAEESIAA